MEKEEKKKKRPSHKFKIKIYRQFLSSLLNLQNVKNKVILLEKFFKVFHTAYTKLTNRSNRLNILYQIEELMFITIFFSMIKSNLHFFHLNN